MVGDNRNKWLPYQLDLLERLIDGGTSYDDAVPLVGHTILSCRSKMSEIRSKRRDAERHKPRAIATKPASRRGPIAKRPLAPLLPTMVADPPHLRATSTAKLVMDAELRGRIELQGITAGLLGDPMPGRSALDRKRAGAVDRPNAPDRRYSDFRPNVTLPAGPAR